MHNVKFSSEITVNPVKFSASDRDVAFAARVSTLGEMSRPTEEDADERLSGLINFLMRERHGSPFEHSVFTFYVKAPIFVWREHMRHRIASYNEESGRYRVLQPEFYIPPKDRKLVQVGKPGAYVFEDGTEDQYILLGRQLTRGCQEAYERYELMLQQGIAKEVARMILPVNIYSSAYVTMNARALMNFLSLRVSAEESTFPSHPQREIEIVAERYEELFSTLMPITHKAFVDNGRVAP